MSFAPRFTITNQLLKNITRIHELVTQLNHRRFPRIVLLEFEKDAYALSTNASTSIEGNPLPLTEVRKILKQHPQHARDSEREVLNYNSALKMLHQHLETQGGKLSLQLILRVQKQVTQKLLPASHSGRLREVPVVVNDPRSGRIVFIPPDITDVQPMLKDLVLFTKENRTELDPLILAGLFHKQFVLIHPFIDGNGRTARLASKVLLANMGLNTFHLFSFENYYNQNVTKYFQTVGEFGDYYELEESIDFTNWLEYFTGGVIDELLRVEKLLPTSAPPEHQLKEHHLLILNLAKSIGFITDHEYSRHTSRAKSTRNTDFQKLIDLGLIERHGNGKNSYYVSS